MSVAFKENSRGQVFNCKYARKLLRIQNKRRQAHVSGNSDVKIYGKTLK